MYMKLAIIGLMVTLAVTSASTPEDYTANADIENAINLEPTPTIPFSDAETDATLVARREGAGGGGHHKNSGGSGGKKLGHQNANKLDTGFPTGRWKQTRTCIHKTGSAGNVYATICANPGESPTNIHPPKVTAKPSKPPKQPKQPKQSGHKSKSCSIATGPNGIITSQVCH